MTAAHWVQADWEVRTVPEEKVRLKLEQSTLWASWQLEQRPYWKWNVSIKASRELGMRLITSQTPSRCPWHLPTPHDNSWPLLNWAKISFVDTCSHSLHFDLRQEASPSVWVVVTNPRAQGSCIWLWRWCFGFIRSTLYNHYIRTSVQVCEKFYYTWSTCGSVGHRLISNNYDSDTTS